MPVSSQPAFPVAKAKSSGDKLWVIAAIVAIVAAVCVLCTVLWTQHASDQKAHGQRAIAVAVTLPEGASADGVLIPLSVEGTEEGGAAVSKVVAVTPEGTGLSLAPGSYQVAPAADVIAGDGSYLASQGMSFGITVGKDSAVDATLDASEANFQYQTVDESKVTDDQISAATDALAAAGVESATVASAKDKATAVRDEATSKAEADAAQKAAEEETARQQAAEEVARAAAVDFECDYFTVDVPDSWDGLWSVQQKNSTTWEFMGRFGQNANGAATVYVGSAPSYTKVLGTTSSGRTIYANEAGAGFFGNGKATLTPK